MIARTHMMGMLGLILVALAASAIMMSRIPEPAPVHWNLHGEVDRMGPRWQVVWLMPAVLLGVGALLAVLPALGPLRANMEQFRVIYGRICVLSMIMLVAMHVSFLFAASGAPIRVGATITIAGGVMMMFIGNWLGKVRRNFYLGVRTPWTLANEVVWEKTHRHVGPLMMIHGLVSVVTGFLAPDWLCFVVFVGGISAVCLWAVLYSYLVYRKTGSVDDMSVRGAG